MQVADYRALWVFLFCSQIFCDASVLPYSFEIIGFIFWLKFPIFFHQPTAHDVNY